MTVPVHGVDRALEFYQDRLGRRINTDIRHGDDIRVVQVTPTGDGHTSIVFGVGVTTAAPGSMRHLELVTSDIEAAREELVGRGVDVTAVYHSAGSVFRRATRMAGPDPARTSWDSFASSADPDEISGPL